MAALADPETRPHEAFRAEARDRLVEHFPPELKGKEATLSALEAAAAPSPAEVRWTAAMGDKGWGVPTWPAAHGRGGPTWPAAIVSGICVRLPTRGALRREERLT